MTLVKPKKPTMEMIVARALVDDVTDGWSGDAFESIGRDMIRRSWRWTGVSFVLVAVAAALGFNGPLAMLAVVGWCISSNIDIRLWREGKAYVQVGESFGVVRRLLVARRAEALSSPVA